MAQIEKILENKIDDFIIKHYINKFDSVLKGGAGSGHWGHRGVKGQRGGSAKGRLGSASKYSWKEQMAKSPDDIVNDLERDMKALNRRQKAQEKVFNQKIDEYNALAHELHEAQIDYSHYSVRQQAGELQKHEEVKLKEAKERVKKIERRREQLSKDFHNRAEGVSNTREEMAQVAMTVLNFSEGNGKEIEPTLIRPYNIENERNKKNYYKVAQAGIFAIEQLETKMLSPEMISKYRENSGSKPSIDIVPEIGRAWCRTTGDKGSKDTIIRLPKEYTEFGFMGTAVHEMGHSIEKTVPDVLEASVDFYRMRTTSDVPETLTELTGIQGYRENEYSKPDDFMDVYTGKLYGNIKHEKLQDFEISSKELIDIGIVTATEVFSTGLERVLDVNWSTGKTASGQPIDREHIAYTISVLQGKHKEFIENMKEGRGFK